MSTKQADSSGTQFLKFLLVCIINGTVNTATYLLIVTLGGHYILGNIGGFTLSVLCNYFISGRFVFKRQTDEKRVWWKVLPKLYLSNGFTGLILVNILSWVWINVVHLDTLVIPLNASLANAGLVLTDMKLAEYLMPFINMFVVIPLNFIFSKYWAYRPQKAKQPPASELAD